MIDNCQAVPGLATQITGIRAQYLYKIETGKAYGLNSSHIFIFAKAFKIKLHEVVMGI